MTLPQTDQILDMTGMIRPPWAVVDQKSPGQIGLKGAGAIDPNPKQMEYFIFCTP